MILQLHSACLPIGPMVPRKRPSFDNYPPTLRPCVEAPHCHAFRIRILNNFPTILNTPQTLQISGTSTLLTRTPGQARRREHFLLERITIHLLSKKLFSHVAHRWLTFPVTPKDVSKARWWLTRIGRSNSTARPPAFYCIIHMLLHVNIHFAPAIWKQGLHNVRFQIRKSHIQSRDALTRPPYIHSQLSLPPNLQHSIDAHTQTHGRSGIPPAPPIYP
jgi:hypothetical protein